MGDLLVGSSAPPGPPAAPETVTARLGRAALLLAVATALALASSAVVLGLVFRADFLTAAAASVVRLMFEHGVLAAALAASPLFAVLLVGYGYMQRAIRRRAAQKAGGGAVAVPAARR